MFTYIKAKTIPNPLKTEGGDETISLLTKFNDVTKKLMPVGSTRSMLLHFVESGKYTIEQLAEEFDVKLEDLKEWLKPKENN